ncbi:MAG TPA: type II toxin-antitoxin system RatA family toxin [Gammaproteobacteria bacterium]|nr:type II toxin-antitoxin system RatA family toxin [Gammaproteobacteria bacterium]
MAEVGEQLWLPFGREGVFALVADIERYPEFVPRYRESRILDRDGRRLAVEQVVGIGGALYRFRSWAELEPPRALWVRTTDFPFREMTVRWRFEPAGEGCRVALRMAFRLRLPLVSGPAGSLAGRAARQTLGAFEARAYELLGPGGGAA